MTEATVAELSHLARRVRAHVIRMASGGGCFIGASLSCADLLVHLYARVLNVSPARQDDPQRDYLLLSKGHDVPALYGTLSELGWFSPERLANHLSLQEHIYWHPNRQIPGIEFHSGSLGHLLSVGIGIALDLKLCETNNRVFVVLGDGEMNEGSVWEALLVAAAQKLDNLVVVIDRNGFQANVATEDLVPLEPLAAKLSAFGWHTIDVDGHDFGAMDNAFNRLHSPGRPTAVVAHTQRGKGIASLEGRADRWFVKLSPTEVESMLEELNGMGAATLSSQPLVVR